MRFLKEILTVAIICAAYVGDNVVFRSKYSNSVFFRALADSFVHAILGCLSSLIFFCHLNYDIDVCTCDTTLCIMLSVIIDVDHPIVARSLSLKDMMNLTQRGIFHCTTFCILTTALCLTFTYLTRRPSIYLLTFMMILGWTSHHLRDGNRRGLWFYPFGSTPPINTFLYIFLLAVLPHVFGYAHNMFEDYFTKGFFVERPLGKRFVV